LTVCKLTQTENFVLSGTKIQNIKSTLKPREMLETHFDANNNSVSRILHSSASAVGNARPV